MWPAADTCVMLDLGARVLRVGVCGEPAPRAVIDAAAAASQLAGRPLDALWELDMMHVADAAQADARRVELVRVLARLLRTAWQTHILVDPAHTRVLCAHSPLLIGAVQDALCHVLLHHVGAAAVSFVDTHTLALVAAGRATGLVVDIGHLETCALPIYAGRPIRRALRTTPRAGRRVRAALSALVGAPVSTELVAQTVLVSADYPAAAHALAGVPADARVGAAEVLFAPGDEDELSIVECVVSALRDVPLDARRDVLASAVVAGGTAMLPGLARRLQLELQTRLPHSAVRVLNAPSAADAPLPMAALPASLLTWLGGSIAGSLGARGTLEITRTQWLAAGRPPARAQ